MFEPGATKWVTTRSQLMLLYRSLQPDLLGAGPHFLPVAVTRMHALRHLHQTEAAERGHVARNGAAVPARTRGDRGDRAGVGLDGAKQRHARRRQEPEQIARILERDDLPMGDAPAGVGKLRDSPAGCEKLFGPAQLDRDFAHFDLRFRNCAISASNGASMSSKLENLTVVICPI